MATATANKCPGKPRQGSRPESCWRWAGR